MALPPHLQTAPPPFTIPPLGTVLITGGCGFLGSHIVSLLLSRNHSPINTQIHVLDVRSPLEPFAGVKYHTADLTSASSISTVLGAIKPDVVIHTASPPAFDAGSKSKAQTAKVRGIMYAVNVDGTRNLLEESKKLGVSAFVYTSSPSVISDNVTDLVNADESYTVIRGKLQGEYYSETKAEAEQLALSANSRTGTPFLTTAIRPSAMFGERDAQFIPNLLQVVRDGRTGFQLGENNNLFDCTYVGNIAQAHIQAAVKLLELRKKIDSGIVKAGDEENEDESGARVDGEAFIITNQAPVYFWDFYRAVWHSYYRQSPPSTRSKLKEPKTSTAVIALPKDLALFISTVLTFVMGVLGLGKPSLEPMKVRFSCMTRYFRTRKAEAALGYVPETPLDEGVERTVRWFVEREQRARGGQAVEGKKER